MEISRAIKLALVGGVSLASIAAAQAQAQTQPKGQQDQAAASGASELTEIVVTAQKRSESVQKVPIAIAAVSGEDLQRRQVTSFETLAPSLPSVNFGKNMGFARIAIRGVGFDATLGGAEGRVAYHSDGIYISRPNSQLSTFFDINRVEVVRGPQGTLYGRNATAGAVNVITNDPEDTLSGYVKGTIGNYNLFQEEGAITGPVSDKASARFAFTKTDRGGYGKNLVTSTDIDNEHSVAVRGKVKIEPSSTVKLILSADYSDQEDAAYVYHYIGQGNPLSPARAVGLGGAIPPNPRDSYANVPQQDTRRNYGLGATLSADLGGVNLTSVTGYRYSLADIITDHDGTQANISTWHNREKAKQFSEELRLDGQAGRLKWLVGAYYFHENNDAEADFSPVLTFSGAFLSRGFHANADFGTKAAAAFGQLDYEIIDRVTVSAGLRYSYEKKTIDQAVATEFFTPATPSYFPSYTAFLNDSISFNSTTPRFSIQWQATDDVMLYATYAKGFKSGGFNLAGPTPVLPEKLTDYEGGVKATLLDGVLRLNGSVFNYDYKNLQVQRVLNATAFTVNAGAARVRGVEGEVTIRPVRGLEISGNASYLDAKFTEFSSEDTARPNLGLINLKGNRLPQAPKYTGNLAVQYSVPTASGSVRLRGEMAYTSRVYFSFYNRPEVSQTGYTKFNVSLSYEASNGITASAWIKNIDNKRTFSSTQVSSGFLNFPVVGTFDPPRTFGGSLGYRF